MDYKPLQKDFLKNGRNHFIVMEPTNWFDACLIEPETDVWSRSTADGVEEELENKGLIGKRGWHELKARVKSKRCDENVAYETLVNYSEQIAGTLEVLWRRKKQTKAPPRTTKYCAFGAEHWSKEDSYQPDSRFVLITDTQGAGEVKAEDKINGNGRVSIHQPGNSGETNEPKGVRGEEEVGRGDLEKGLGISGADCAGIAQWKLSASDEARVENEMETVSGPCLLFFKDPRRTRAYAISMEKGSTRLWCFDRGGIRTTRRFNCHKNPAWLIRFFLYLTFADMEKLGYDATVRRMLDDRGEVFYIYQCEETYYRTIGPPLAEEIFLVSSGVRSWRVRECNEHGKVQSNVDNVLKDYWPHESCSGEKAKQDAVLESETFNNDDRDLFQNSSTTIISDIHIENRQTIPWGEESKWERETFRYRFPGDIVPPRSLGNLWAKSSDGSCVPDTIPLPSTPRSHRRMVMKEWCVPISRMCDPTSGYHRVGNLKDLLEVVSHFAQTLDVLRKAGYVHRDVSAGNCLAYWDESEQRWQGKLSYFESCKPYAAVSSRDPIRGDLSFAAIEAIIGCYLFTLDESETSEQEMETGNLFFRYNPYHDLEALYWVAVWVLVSHILVTNSENVNMDEDGLDAWRTSMADIFRPGGKFIRQVLLKQQGSQYLWRRLTNTLNGWGWSKELLELLRPVLKFGPNEHYYGVEYESMVKKPASHGNLIASSLHPCHGGRRAQLGSDGATKPSQHSSPQGRKKQRMTHLAPSSPPAQNLCLRIRSAFGFLDEGVENQLGFLVHGLIANTNLSISDFSSQVEGGSGKGLTIEIKKGDIEKRTLPFPVNHITIFEVLSVSQIASWVDLIRCNSSARQVVPGSDLN
ncbi:hypothetical protein BKA70DRAFT_1526130 [Coprinopsis sp. MPI-PUGE-AT-0042]|nr:hypothetical protein BKA70DRAFT_1526130 [Coprinopsis sp. MPI-PUGE-AT-0042]